MASVDELISLAESMEPKQTPQQDVDALIQMAESMEPQQTTSTQDVDALIAQAERLAPTRQPYGATRSFEAPPTETAVPSTTEVELPEPEREGVYPGKEYAEEPIKIYKNLKQRAQARQKEQSTGVAPAASTRVDVPAPKGIEPPPELKSREIDYDETSADAIWNTEIQTLPPEMLQDYAAKAPEKPMTSARQVGFITGQPPLEAGAAEQLRATQEQEPSKPGTIGWLFSLPENQQRQVMAELEKTGEANRAGALLDYLKVWYRTTPGSATLAGGFANIPGVVPERVMRIAEEKNPALTTTGKVGGAIVQAIALAHAGAAGLAKVPFFANNPLALQAVTRGLVSTGISGGQGVAEMARGRGDFKEAISRAAQAGGAGIFSMVPEIVAPAGLGQLIAQPAGGLLYDATIDALARGEELNKEWMQRELVNIAIDLGFAIRDVASGDVFKGTQKDMRQQILKTIGRGDKVAIDRLGAKPEVKPEQEPRTKIRVGKKDTDTLTKLANTSRTKKYLDSIYANKKGRANHWFLSFDADKFKAINDVYGHPAGDQVLKQLGEITRRFFPEKFTGREGGEEFLVDLGESLTPGMEQRVKEFLNAVATEVKIEGQPVTISAGLAKGLSTTIGGEPRLLSDKMAYESKKVGRNTLTIDKDGEVSYTKGVEAGEKGYLKPHLKTSTEEGINELYRLGAIDEDTYAQLREGVRRIQTGEETSGRGVQPEVPPEARTEAKQEVTEPAKPEPTPEEQEVEASLSVKVDAGTPAETRPPEGPKAPDPPIKPDEDTPEFAETQQFANRSGGVSPKGQQQYKPPTLETEEARGATRFQEVMDKGRKEVKDKYGHPKYLTKGDLWASRLWDHLSPITRRLAKVPGGDKVVEVLRLLQGAQAESARVYRVAKKKIYDKLPHRYQDMFDDYLTAHRIIETQELKGEDFKQPGKITPEEAQAWLDNLKNNAPEQHKLIESLAQEYWGVWRDEVELKYNEGIIDKGLRDYLLEHHRHFNPRRFIQHLDPHVKGEGPGGGRQISTTQSGIKALEEGSEQALMSNSRLLLAEGIMRNRSIVFRNRANRALMAFIRENPDNPLGTKIDESNLRKVSMDDAQSMAENLGGKLAKLQGESRQPAQLGPTEEKLATLNRKIDAIFERADKQIDVAKRRIEKDVARKRAQIENKIADLNQKKTEIYRERPVLGDTNYEQRIKQLNDQLENAVEQQKKIGDDDAVLSMLDEIQGEIAEAKGRLKLQPTELKDIDDVMAKFNDRTRNLLASFNKYQRRMGVEQTKTIHKILSDATKAAQQISAQKTKIYRSPSKEVLFGEKTVGEKIELLDKQIAEINRAMEEARASGSELVTIKQVEGYGEVPHGMDRIWAFEGGERKAMLMPSELAQFYVTADPQTRQEIAPVLRVMSGAPMLRAMATGYNPGFAIGNVPRDLMHMWFVTDEYSPILPIAWKQQFEDMKAVRDDVFHRRGIVTEYIRPGGGLEALTSEGRALRKRPWERRTEVGEQLAKLDEFLSWGNETSELWTRCALYRRARLNGKSEEEAAYIARTYIDFAQGGSWIKFINQVIPYLNAGIQGTRGVFRAYKDNPQLAVAKTAQITALGASLAYWNRSQNEEAWGEISEREKATGWIITTPWKYKDADGNMRHFYFKIAKDQAQQIFAMIGEELMEGQQTGKPNWQKIRMASTELMPVDAGNILPPTVSSFLGYVTNKDFWLNDDIWKGRKDISPEEEYWNTTPEAWVVWGKATGMSPERSRRAFHKVFPKNVYTHLTESFVDELFGTLSDEEKLEMSKPFIEKLKKMAESPVSRRIIRQTWPRSKKTEELLRDADEFGVDTHYDNGKTLSFFDLQRKVHDARIKQSDKRIQLDRRFDRLARLATLESEVAQKDFMRELNALKENNYDEYKRIVQRVKDRHPNVLNGRFIIEMKLEQPRGWEDRLEILQWFKNAKPEDKAKVAKKFPDLSSRMENITNNLIGGGNRRSQHEKFESRFRQLKKQLLEGDINKSEYDNKTEKLRADMKAFNRAVKKFGGGRK